MPTDFFKALRDNEELLNSLFGNIDNLISKHNYSDALAHLKKNYEQPANDSQRYQSISQSIRNIGLQDEDYNNTEKSIDYSNPKIQKSQAYQQYRDNYLAPYREQLAKPQAEGKTAPAQLTFEQYVSQDPILQNEINTNYLKETSTNRSEEEMQAIKFQKAGLMPEDVEFYKNYKPVNSQAHNRKLSMLLGERAPYLISSGSYKDQYAQLFGQQVKNFALPELKDSKYEIRIDEKSGNVLLIDPVSGEVIKKPYTTPQAKEKKPFQFSADAEIQAYNDKEGNAQYGWFEPDPAAEGGWKFTGVKATQDQIDKLNKTGPFASKRTGGTSRRRGSTSRKSSFDIDKLSPDQIRALTSEQIKAMDVQNLATLNSKYASVLTDDQKKVMKESLGKTYVPTDPTSPNNDLRDDAVLNDVPSERAYEGEFDSGFFNEYDPETNTFESEHDRGVGLERGSSRQNYFNSLRDEAPDDNYREAFDAANVFFDTVTSQWGRSNLTPDEWRDEIGQEAWTDIEFNIVKEIFKKMTGEDY